MHIITLDIVPASQSAVTVMHSHGDQPRKHDKKSQMEINNGKYVCIQVFLEPCIHEIILWIYRYCKENVKVYKTYSVEYDSFMCKMFCYSL